MSLLNLIFRRKKPVPVFDPNPAEVDWMPARPYRVLHADLPFYSDSECQTEVQGARLIVLQSQDSKQNRTVIECMPVLKHYKRGQLVSWELNNKNIWETSWYRNPNTGEIEKAWSQAVEFTGSIVRVEEKSGGDPAPKSGAARQSSVAQAS